MDPLNSAKWRTWEDGLQRPLTWSLVFDEEKLQALLEGVFIHIKLHLHPIREERKATVTLRSAAQTPRSHADVFKVCNFAQREYSLCCFSNHLPEEGLVIICLWFCSQLQERVTVGDAAQSKGAKEQLSQYGGSFLSRIKIKGGNGKLKERVHIIIILVLKLIRP